MDFVAPIEPGTYTANFKLVYDKNDIDFGGKAFIDIIVKEKI